MKDYTEQTILDAIKNSSGILTTVANRLGCEWHTAKKYVEQYESTQRALLNEKEALLDKAESQVVRLIDEKDAGMIKWYLEKQGKKRDYGDSKQIDITSGGEALPSKIIIQPMIGIEDE